MIDDHDKDYILSGLRNGFDIVDCDSNSIPPAVTDNHKSAVAPERKDKVEHQINQELMEGNYIITQHKPQIISALAAIDKPDGDIRLIHDFSRPENRSVNDFALKDYCEYQSLDDAIKLLTPSSYMAKVDLKSAYRSVEINSKHQPLTGLQWTFKDASSPTFIIDKCLGFGARKSPHIFNRITQAVCRMMQRRNFNCVCYLDDFFLCEASFAECQQALATLITLLRSLNFKINWKKVVDPCRIMTFLGVQINLHEGQIRLDPEKAVTFCKMLKDTAMKKRITKKLLQTIAGRLIWASRVHPWGKYHTAPVFHLIRTLHSARHKALLSSTLRSELDWWIDILSTGNNCKAIWDDARPITIIATDSSSCAGGVFCGGDCTYVNWLIDRPSISSKHINIKELAAVEIAVCTYAPLLPNSHLIIYSDNTSVCHIVNKGYSRNACAAKLLRNIAVTSLEYNCRITACHIPGDLNDIPDAISRLHQRGQRLRLLSLLRQYNPAAIPVCGMSSLSNYYLLQLWGREADSSRFSKFQNYVHNPTIPIGNLMSPISDITQSSFC